MVNNRLPPILPIDFGLFRKMRAKYIKRKEEKII